MLVISRRPGERIKIGDVVLTVLETHRGSVRLGFVGPGVLIIRAELDEHEMPASSGRHERPARQR
jgi:carbon storage regulator CsrA